MKNLTHTFADGVAQSTALVIVALLGNVQPSTPDKLRPLWRVQNALEDQQDSEVLSLPLRDWGLIRDWFAATTLPNNRLVGQILDMIDAEVEGATDASD
jgi:hypothetical protein